MTSSDHYDVIVIGTGAGGGTLAHTLAASGKRILLLERGNFLPRETQNWAPKDVFLDGRYISPDTWYDADGTPFQPQVHYFVGGATKLYGAALYRLRPQDFGEIAHVDGISPAWPLGYDDFEPWYTTAEWLYQVHGSHGADPTEGHWSQQYPWPAVSHEPRIQEISDALAAAGPGPDDDDVVVIAAGHRCLLGRCMPAGEFGSDGTKNGGVGHPPNWMTAPAAAIGILPHADVREGGVHVRRGAGGRAAERNANAEAMTQVHYPADVGGARHDPTHEAATDDPVGAGCICDRPSGRVDFDRPCSCPRRCEFTRSSPGSGVSPAGLAQHGRVRPPPRLRKERRADDDHRELPPPARVDR